LGLQFLLALRVVLLCFATQSVQIAVEWLRQGSLLVRLRVRNAIVFCSWVSSIVLEWLHQVMMLMTMMVMMPLMVIIMTVTMTMTMTMMMMMLRFCGSLRSRKCMGMSREAFCAEIYTGKMAEDTSAASVLCEPAQSKCTWTCQTRHFARKFTGKMPDPYSAASVLREPAQSKCKWT
jgi:hypothetical protein